MLGSMFLPSKVNHMKVYSYIDIVLSTIIFIYGLYNSQPEIALILASHLTVAVAAFSRLLTSFFLYILH